MTTCRAIYGRLYHYVHSVVLTRPAAGIVFELRLSQGVLNFDKAKQAF